MRKVGSRWRLIFVLMRCLGLAAIAAQSHADNAVRHFDIQTQTAASALNEFARQADITLVFSSTLVAKHQTVSIRGDYTVTDALRRLLAGSGLSFKQISATTIAISSQAPVNDSPD